MEQSNKKFFDLDGNTPEGTINFLHAKREVQNWTNSNYPDLVTIFLKDEIPTLKEVEEEPEPADGKEISFRVKEKYRIDYKAYKDQEIRQIADLKRVYGHLHSTCSYTLQEELKKEPNWMDISSKIDPLALWIAMKKVIFNDERDKVHPMVKKTLALERFQRFHQHQEESLIDFRERFDLEVEILENATVGFKILASGEKREEDLATTFLLKLSRKLYGNLVKEIENNYVMTNGAYPSSISKVISLAKDKAERPQKIAMFTHRGKPDAGPRRDRQSSQSPQGQRQSGPTQSPQVQRPTGSTSSPQIQRPTVHPISPYDQASRRKLDLRRKQRTQTGNDQKRVRYSSDNEKVSQVITDSQTDSQLIYTPSLSADEHSVNLALNEVITDFEMQCLITNTSNICEDQLCDGVRHTDLVLDSCSNVNVFNLKQYLSNIRFTSFCIGIKGFGGNSSVVNQLGWFEPLQMNVYYHPNAPANVLCFHDINKSHNLSFNSKENHFELNVKGQTEPWVFESINKIYVHRYMHMKAEPSNTCLIQTVEGNKLNFTPREVTLAEEALKLQELLGYPSTSDLKRIIRHNSVKDTSVTLTHIDNATKIFGPNLARIRGTTRRETPEHVPPTEVNEELFLAMGHYKSAPCDLCVDLFKVSKTWFLVAYLQRIGMIFERRLLDRGVEWVLSGLEGILNSIRAKGIIVDTVKSDGESAIKFTSEKKWSSLKVKLNMTGRNEHVPDIERMGGQLKDRVRAHLVSMPYNLPEALIPYLVTHCVICLNSVPRTQTVGTGTLSPRELFTGNVTNINTSFRLPFGSLCEMSTESGKDVRVAKTQQAIYLGTSGTQGTYILLALDTLKEVRRHSVIPRPMPKDVVDFLNLKASLDGNKANQLAMELGGRPITDLFLEPDDPEIIPVNLDKETTPKEQGSISRVEQTAEVSSLPIPCGTVEDSTTSNHRGMDDRGTGVIPDSSIATPPPTAEKMSLRSRTKQAWAETHLALFSYVEYRSAICLTQLSVKKGLKSHFDLSKKAILKEFRQLREKNVYTPINIEDLTPGQKSSIVPSLFFLKFKRDGSLKGRFVVDGSKQDKDGSGHISSPTVAVESIFTTAIIDAMEKRYVITIDIEGAFLHASMPNDVFVRIRSELADFVCEISPEYATLRTKDGSLVVKLDKALYGCIESPRLFYCHLRTSLEGLGYSANPYDECVFTKMVDNQQTTLTIHVDDLKISSRDKRHIDTLLTDLKTIYGNVTIHEGPVFDYLGMKFDYTRDGEIRISMDTYIKELCEEFDVNIHVKCPHTCNLFVISDSPRLSKQDKERFHGAVAKMLYMAKRARPDILTAISFLTTRIMDPTEEDHGKLIRVIKYLYGTKDLPLTLSANMLQDNEVTITAYVDASYATHDDCKGHTGAAITLGQGILYAKSSKQKTVARSSTEAELNAVDDSLRTLLWLQNFLHHLGYGKKPILLYQDNISAMHLAQNGYSRSSRTRHLDIRLFFIKEQIESGKVREVHLGTDDMLGDFFTKPIVGSRFEVARNLILNCPMK